MNNFTNHRYYLIKDYFIKGRYIQDNKIFYLVLPITYHIAQVIGLIQKND